MLEIRRRWMTPLFIPSQCIRNGDGCLESASFFPAFPWWISADILLPYISISLSIKRRHLSTGTQWRDEGRCWLCVPGAGHDSGAFALGFVSNPQQLGGSSLGTAHKQLADDHNPTPNTLLPHVQLQTDAWTHTNCSKDCTESVKQRQNGARVCLLRPGGLIRVVTHLQLGCVERFCVCIFVKTMKSYSKIERDVQ